MDDKYCKVLDYIDLLREAYILRLVEWDLKTDINLKRFYVSDFF